MFNSDLVESDITRTDYIKFYVNKGEEDVSCEFFIEDIDIFLQMITMIVSGAISEKVINLILQNIDNEEIKEHFMTAMIKMSQDNLSELSERSVIKPSEFQV